MKINMEHCQFENAFYALEQCLETLENYVDLKEAEADTNPRDARFIEGLLRICSDMAEIYG